ncbi:MAG: hypothetical protein KBT20_06175 [Bacteroidales bacterium]|nr:hypothetical protein [Candidatus Liminaster caballi]
MEKKTLIVETLKDLGLRPILEGNMVTFRYQLKNIFCIIDDEPDDYICLFYPDFYEVSATEKISALYACNKVAKDIRHVKVYVDDDIEFISASSEFFFNSKESLKLGIKNGLELFGIIGTWIVQVLTEFNSDKDILPISKSSDDEEQR